MPKYVLRSAELQQDGKVVAVRGQEIDPDEYFTDAEKADLLQRGSIAILEEPKPAKAKKAESETKPKGRSSAGSSAKAEKSDKDAE